MDAIPDDMRHLPVYITETDQGDEPWRDDNSGWVKAAYGEIDDWNQNNSQKIRSLILYRWPNIDRWYIEGKSGVIEDFQEALAFGYKWTTDEPRRPEDDPEDKPVENQTMTKRLLNDWKAWKRNLRRLSRRLTKLSALPKSYISKKRNCSVWGKIWKMWTCCTPA